MLQFLAHHEAASDAETASLTLLVVLFVAGLALGGIGRSVALFVRGRIAR